MFVGNGKVNVCLTLAFCIESALYKMFFHWGASSLVIVMEQQHTLRQLSVVHTISAEHILNYSLVLAVGNEFFNSLTFVLLAHCIKLFEECKALDVSKIYFLKVCCGHVVWCIKECKHILEHSTGSATCRNELNNFTTFGFVVVPSLYKRLTLAVTRSNNTVANTCCRIKF